jgi:replicative DNA helicase
MKLSAPIYQLKRHAKQISRENKIPLNQALNTVAKQEGLENWSLLAALHAKRSPATKLLSALKPRDLVLLGARPGHGKTLMGFELIIESIKDGNHAAFYSLEYTEKEVIEHFKALGISELTDALTFDTSDEISADYIIRNLKVVPSGTVVVIDYLQLLDQNREKPILNAQISALKSFAETEGIIIVLLSQIDRSFEPMTKPLPDITDIRLPNPLDFKLFSKTIFLNNGEINLRVVA